RDDIVNQEIHLQRSCQRFVHDVDSLPSEPITVRVETTDGVVQHATTGSCSIDVVETELAATAPTGSGTLALTSTAAITACRRYALTDPDGGREAIVVGEVRTRDVDLDRRLIRTFEAGAQLRGFQLSIGVDPAWQKAQARYVELGATGLSAFRVRWTYALDGIPTHAVSYVDVVFEPRDAVVTPASVERKFPGWADGANEMSRGAT